METDMTMETEAELALPDGTVLTLHFLRSGESMQQCLARLLGRRIANAADAGPLPGGDQA